MWHPKCPELARFDCTVALRYYSQCSRPWLSIEVEPPRYTTYQIHMVHLRTQVPDVFSLNAKSELQWRREISVAAAPTNSRGEQVTWFY